jgi:hypothetical protein
MHWTAGFRFSPRAGCHWPAARDEQRSAAMNRSEIVQARV